MNEERTVHIPPRGVLGPPPHMLSGADMPGRHWPAARIAGPGYAPGWPPTPTTPPWPPARQRGRRTWWIVVAAALALVTIVVVAVVVANHRPDSAPAPHRPSESGESASAATTSEPPAGVTPVAVSALSGLLLSLPEVATVAGSARVVGHIDDGERIFEDMADGAIVEQDCVSLLPAKQRAYKGSGYIASRQQYLTGESPERQIAQSVVSFADATAAANYVTAAKSKWERCANRTVNLTSVTATDKRAIYWMTGAVSETDRVLSISRVQEGGAGWVCQTGLTARNNVVVDFYICGVDVAPSVVPAYAGQVAAKIDGAK